MTWHVISHHSQTLLSQRLLGGITLQLDGSLCILMDLAHAVLGSAVEGVGRERRTTTCANMCHTQVPWCIYAHYVYVIPADNQRIEVDSFRTCWSPRHSHIGVEVLGAGPQQLCFEAIWIWMVSQWISQWNSAVWDSDWFGRKTACWFLKRSFQELPLAKFTTGSPYEMHIEMYRNVGVIRNAQLVNYHWSLNHDLITNDQSIVRPRF